MGGLFSKKDAGHGGAQAQGRAAAAAPQTTKQLSVKDKAVLDLKVARDRLAKAQKKHEQAKEVYVAKARELLKAKKKDQAKLALRLKKMRDTQIDKITGQLANLEQMVNDVEWAQHQTEIVEGMKAGNAALKALQLDPDEVADIMQDTQEAMDRQQEIDGIISEALNPEDEQAALAELEELEKATAAELAASLPTPPEQAKDPIATTNPTTETTAPAQAAAATNAADDLSAKLPVAPSEAVSVGDVNVQQASTESSAAAAEAEEAKQPVLA